MRKLCLICLIIAVMACFVACDTEDDFSADDFLAKWQDCIKDEARLVDIAIPGTHDSGTLNVGGDFQPFNDLFQTQGYDYYDQLIHGIRYFDTRVSRGEEYDEDGELVDDNALMMFHAVANFGMTFGKVCDDINKFFEDYPDQFIILDFQHFAGGVESDVRMMIEQKLNPSKYAVKNTTDLSTLTMGDVRRLGLRYVIVWGSTDIGSTDYIFDRESSLISPYVTENHNYGTDNLIENAYPDYLAQRSNGAFFVLQAQLTASVSSSEGIVSGTILQMEEYNNPKMNAYIRSLCDAKNAEILSKINVVMRDYIDLDGEKVKCTLALNLAKNCVKEDFVDIFESLTAKA